VAASTSTYRRSGISACLALLASALAASAPAAGAARVEVDAGRGTRLTVQEDPFRVVVRDAAGAETVATPPARQGPPVRLPGVDGPLPLEPLGALGGFPAVGWVVGARAEQTFPVGFFSGNRLFGAEAGALVSATRVTAARRTPSGGWEADLETDAPAAGPARLEVVSLPGGGARLRLRPPSGLPVVASVFTLLSPPGEGLYGLGARKDAFDQRGRLRNVWVEQQNASSQAGGVDQVPAVDPTGATGPEYTFPNGAQAAYYVQSALFGGRGWAAWVGETALGRVDLAASRPDAVRWGVASPNLTLHLAGGGLEAASRAFTAAVGRAPAPPRYVYEPWIDVLNEGEGEAAPNGAGFAGAARVQGDIRTIAAMARRHDIPIGVIGVEGWHTVPAPERFFGALRAQGFRLAAYWNPFTAPSSAAYREALARDLFIKDAAGEPYPIVTNRNNLSYVIDFSHPGAAAFWREQIDRSNRLGFEAFMHDFGEFVTEGMVFHNGEAPATMHNAYPVLYHRAARAAVGAYAAEHPGFEPFFYVRAGYSGIGDGEGVIASTPGVFPGDETTDWARGSGLPSVVPAMLNLALGGSYAYTTDVGGYLDLVAPRTSPELLTRWSQLAAFTAVSRIHNSTGKGTAFPWDFDRATLLTYRRYARAKVRLIGLVDRLSRAAAATGAIGPVRPLVLEDPSAEARAVRDQWLLGRDLLVAPVVEQGARRRRVYLPRGARWERVTVDDAGRFVSAGGTEPGGRIVTAPAPLADIPLYLRVGGDLRAVAPEAASDVVTGEAVRRRATARRARTVAAGRDRGGGSLASTGLGLLGLGAAAVVALLLGLTLRRRRAA